MGVRVYYYMVAAVLGFGVLLPQHGRQKKVYIALMAVLHAFVCGWRYMYLTGAELPCLAATRSQISA